MSKNERDELCESLRLLKDDAVIKTCQEFIDLFDNRFKRNLEKFEEDMKETASDQEYFYDNKEFFLIEYPDDVYNYIISQKECNTAIPPFLRKQICKA